MNLKRVLVLVIAILYFISPLDLVPGILLDDLIFIAIGIYNLRLPSEKISAAAENET